MLKISNHCRAERAWDFTPEIGVVLAGGENSTSEAMDRVEMSDDFGDSFTELPPLPKGLKNGCLVIAGQTLFHAGGRESKDVDILYQEENRSKTSFFPRVSIELDS